MLGTRNVPQIASQAFLGRCEHQQICWRMVAVVDVFVLLRVFAEEF